MTKDEIQKLNPDGTFDEDGFYILKEGDFYDPLGYYFDKDGYDESGGRYDDDGFYIPAPAHVSDDRGQSLTKEEVLALHPEGKFDDDGFYHLKDGDYFDPLGYYFKSDGYDANGGRYDDEGFYIPGKARDKNLVQTIKEDIIKQEGKYNEFGFYYLASGGFYDPFGFKFDDQGLDAVGGFYEEGQYMDPEEEYHDDAEEEYNSEEVDYGAEEYSQYSLDELVEDEALETQAIIDEHVVPALY